MSRAKHFLPALLAVLLLGGLTILAKDSTPVPRGLTVGEFALRIVRLAVDDPDARASVTVDQAMARLKGAGLQFEGAPGEPLTKKDRSAFFFAVANGLMESLSPSPPGFSTCADKTSVPECHACCLALPGSSSSLCGRACGQSHADQQHASP